MALPEILAPAGGQEQLLAAVRCGAEAVYLGGQNFNARRHAANFDDDGLRAAVRYCHERGVTVYLTVNTLILDNELPSLEQTADQAAAVGVDGVILQDMAAARLFSRRYPALHRVASTQTAVHNVDGALFLQDAGFDSFVLARELSLEEMAAICSRTEIPAEAFVHGAHCMSLSGACCLSAMLGGRSGNRGLCAQPCRLDWRCDGRNHVLSLKDMSLLSYIPDLADAGVHTLKIEGRMKRPEYVAAAVTACRAARAGESYDQESLRAVFSRNGFTDGYLLGRLDESMFGTRTKEDVTDGAAVLRGLAGLYHKEMPLVPVYMRFVMNRQETSLTVSDGKNKTTVTGAPPQRALSHPTDGAAAAHSLQKTGGTQYYVSQLDTETEPGLMVPAAALNDLRRRGLAALDELRGEPRLIEKTACVPAPIRPHRAVSPSPLWGRFYKASQIVGTEDLEKIILPVGEISPTLLACFRGRLTAQLPALLPPGEEKALEGRLVELQKVGLTEVWADNVYGIRLGRRLGLTVRGGFGLNITNSRAVEFYEEQGLASLTVSFELPMGHIRALGGSVFRGIAAYGYLPLMLFRTCPLRVRSGCAACRGRESLTDRRGVCFPVECGAGIYSVLLNSVPLHIAGRDDPGDFRLLYFTRETPAVCRRVLEDFRLDRKTDGPHTGGLYYRELL